MKSSEPTLIDVSTCDLCVRKNGSGMGMSVSADTIRGIVKAGYKPEQYSLFAIYKDDMRENLETMRENLETIQNRSRDPGYTMASVEALGSLEKSLESLLEAAFDNWKLVVEASSKPWHLCPSCVSRSGFFMREVVDRWQTALAKRLEAEVSPDTTEPVRFLKGHSDAVNAIELLSAGRCLSASGDGTLKLWELSSGRCLRTFKGHSSFVNCLCVSDDETLIVSGGLDYTVRFWDIATGKCLHVMKSEESAECLTLVKGDTRLLVGGRKSVQMWRLPREVGRAEPIGDIIVRKVKEFLGRSDRPARHFDVDRALYCMDANRKQALLGGWAGPDNADPFLKVVNLGAFASERRLNGHYGSVSSVAFSQTGNVAASGGGAGDGSVRIWNTLNWRLRGQFVGHSGSVQSVAFSGNNKFALTAGLRRTSERKSGWSGEIKLWDVQTGLCLRTFLANDKGANAAAMSQDGKLIVTASKDGLIRVWSLEHGSARETSADRSGDRETPVPQGRRLIAAQEAQKGAPKTRESFRFRCPECGKGIEAPTRMIGKHAKCPGCSARICVSEEKPEQSPLDEEDSRQREAPVEIKRQCVKCSKSFMAEEGEMAPLMRAMSGLIPGNPAQAVGLVGSGMKCKRCGVWICADCAAAAAMEGGAGMLRHDNCGGMFEIP